MCGARKPPEPKSMCQQLLVNATICGAHKPPGSKQFGKQGNVSENILIVYLTQDSVYTAQKSVHYTLIIV